MPTKEKLKECKGRNWKAKYMTIERFEKFCSNDFWHLKVKVNAVLWIVLTILGAIIAKWIMGT